MFGEATFGGFNLDGLATGTPVVFDFVLRVGAVEVDLGLGPVELIVGETALTAKLLTVGILDPNWSRAGRLEISRLYRDISRFRWACSLVRLVSERTARRHRLLLVRVGGGSAS